MTQRVDYLQIEPTTRCNYTCGFCAGRHMQQMDLPFEQFTALLDSLENLRHIELQGEGEPLLHPRFFDMIRYAQTRFPQVEISFITNGSLFTSDNIEQLLSTNINTLLVSIESADEDEFQSIRGGKLSRVKRGIQELIERKTAQNSPLKIGFAITVLKQTVTQINHIGALYESLGMDGGIIIQPLQNMECYTQFYNDEMRQSIPNQQDGVQLKQLIATDNTLKQALASFQSNKSFYSGLFRSIPAYPPRCAWLENGLYVSADGIAASCCYVKDSKKDGYAVIDNNLEDILAQRKAQSNALSKGQIPSQCKGCGVANKIVRQLIAGATGMTGMNMFNRPNNR